MTATEGDIHAIARRARSHRPTDDPAWVDTLRAILVGALPGVHSEQGLAASPLRALIALASRSTGTQALNPRAPLPFEDVWMPVLEVARQGLVQRLAHAAPDRVSVVLHVTEEAYGALERDLLERLTALGEQALYAEFSAARGSEQELRLLLLGGTGAARRRYDEFAARLADERLLPLFTRYPVLAGLVALAVQQWVNATGEFVERLSLDGALVSELASTTAGRIQTAAQDALRVTRIRPGLSDLHHGGRTVIAVACGGGNEAVYKPRGLATELAFNRFLAWCTTKSMSPSFRPVRCVDRGSYGWEECIENAPCSSSAERGRFYERAGALLCVLHALRGTDGHRDNLVACGEFPVLVDAETVMQPEAGVADPSVVPREDVDFVDSVVRTGLLPRWYVNADQRLVLDISALGGTAGDQACVSTREWHALNTDDMHPARSPVALSSSASDPGGAAGPPGFLEHVDDVVRGFRQTYRNLVRQRESLLARGGPLDGFQCAPVRYVFRPTVVYTGILHRALSPEHLAGGIEHHRALEAAARVCFDSAHAPRSWPILKAELRALEQMDIPCFLVPSDSRDLPLGDGDDIDDYFAASGLADVVSRIEAMNEADLEMQTTIIRGAFAARVATDTPSGPVSAVVPAGPPFGGRLAPHELIREARAIAAQVSAAAIRSNGGLHWLGLREIEGTSRYQLAPLNDSIYDGNCGIALFFAALAAVGNDDDMRACALASVFRVRSRLSAPAPAFAGVSTIGGGLGLGSIAYALATVGALVDDQSVLHDALRVAGLITDERIDADPYLDVMAGCAGAILGLLAVERVTRCGTALERALACGRSLLTRRAAANGSPRAWPQLAGGPPLTGFSHGAAGIAYALLRLYESTRCEEFLDAAREGIAYERLLFDPVSGNWPDLRPGAGRDGRPGFAVGWCHGAPGIGLARLGSLCAFDNEIVRHEIEAALGTTVGCEVEGPDHLCCGVMGRLETLMVAADVFDRPDLDTIAATAVAAVVGRARSSGAYRLPGALPGDLCPALFTGISGIGYQLLRLAEPQRVPSVMLWHTPAPSAARPDGTRCPHSA
jgi:type 2 lantibiotic biosynthesis protein LanM